MALRIPYTDPGIPDARSPARYLWWLIGQQRARAWTGAGYGTAWMVILMVPPYLISRAIDDGLRPRNLPVLAGWAAAVLGVGIITAALAGLRHRTMSFVRMDASFRTITVVARHAVALGATLPRKVSAGEVVNIGVADIYPISNTLTITGPGVGAVIAYAVVAAVLLSVSGLLAAVVLIGVPLLAILLGPLLHRLRHVQTQYRRQQGALTARAGDMVVGLRVLCGLGGKEMFAGRYRKSSRELRDTGYRVGAVISWIDSLAVGLPALFLAAVTWLAARMAARGEISIGDMVAVYGYVAVLVTPVSSFIEGAGDLARGLVSAQRVVTFLNLTPEISDVGGSGPDGPAALHDPHSGFVAPPGALVALVSDHPADAVVLIDRLGRYVDSDVRWGAGALIDVSLPTVRRRIVVADHDAFLFAGTFRESVASQSDHADAEIAAAVHAAVADDIVTGLRDGYDSIVDSDGRNLSGGQRQRLRLVRALLADPEILLLVEPTAAVDAHTESLIGDRLAAARGGRSTVVVSTSPLLLDRADEVAFLSGGRILDTGRHRELLDRNAEYRALVFRAAASEAR
jgi:ABC-type multidrug transport system fused ATPase/permease subunit